MQPKPTTAFQVGRGIIDHSWPATTPPLHTFKDPICTSHAMHTTYYLQDIHGNDDMIEAPSSILAFCFLPILGNYSRAEKTTSCAGHTLLFLCYLTALPFDIMFLFSERSAYFLLYHIKVHFELDLLLKGRQKDLIRVEEYISYDYLFSYSTTLKLIPNLSNSNYH